MCCCERCGALIPKPGFGPFDHEYCDCVLLVDSDYCPNCQQEQEN